MGSFDSVTWQALTAVLTVAALAAAVLLWRRRGAVAGLRMLAVALLPAAAYLTGTLRVLWEIGDAVVGWATRLVFSPTVWLGIGLAVTAVALFLLAGLLGRRRRPHAGEGTRRPHQGSRSVPPAAAGPETAAADRAGEDEDLADIEAILKRHGIS